MTGVYSGGLAYEYTVEPNGYGIVEIQNGKIEPNADFDRLKAAYAKTKNPSGNGGFKENGRASQCPSESEEWEVEGTALPAMPKNAQKYMDGGAGTGPGLSGAGSHFAGSASEGTATAGSGQATRTPNGAAATGSSNAGAAASVEIPIRAVGMVAASVLFGAVLLF
jgi:hypothetical protein